jgi:hypothetical protein
MGRAGIEYKKARPGAINNLAPREMGGKTFGVQRIEPAEIHCACSKSGEMREIACQI